uniref:Uncharacterized protein n=1 Tax=Triticum urartu TaxID=4572 RepID=A0A8R7U529_TRIUA
MLDAVALTPRVVRFIACPTIYNKASPFTSSNVRGSGDGATLRRQVQPLPTPLPTWWFRPTSGSSSSIPDSAAMGLLSLRPGRDPRSACQCRQRRRPRVSFPSWRRCQGL